MTVPAPSPRPAPRLPHSAISRKRGFIRPVGTVVVESDGASAQAMIDVTVTVADDAAGVIDALLEDNASSAIQQVEVRLLDDYECACLDEVQPPSVARRAANARQVVGIERGASPTIKLFGLAADQPYTVAAIGWTEDQAVANACIQNIVLAADQVATHAPHPLILELQDPPTTFCAPDSPVSLFSQIGKDVGLAGVARRLIELSDGDDDPVAEVLDRMANRDEAVAALIETHRAELLATMTSGLGTATKTAPAAAGASLASVRNIEAHTTMRVLDDDLQTIQTGNRFDVEHSSEYVRAEIDGDYERLKARCARPSSG